MNLDEKSIAIVGAGLSGLVCARILQQHGISVDVYEADPDAAARQQGGDLDIHRDTGQKALREAGLYDEFRARTIPGAEAFRVMDKTAHIYLDQPQEGGGHGRPEIKRTVLRQLLIDSLEPTSLHWNRRLVRVTPGERSHTLEFTDGTSTHADLVIGADGAWSRVRSLLTPATPDYVGITLVEIRITDSGRRHPEARAVVGEGSLFALSDSKYIGGHGGDEMALAIGLRVPEDWASAHGVDWTDARAGRAALLAEFDDWSPALTDLIRASDDTFWPRPIYALATGTSWPHVPGVTLAGDAAHLMSPFAGEGANLALIDGADLARAILNGTDLDASLIAYERAIIRRGAKSAAGSARSLEMMFNDTAPKQLVRMFRPMVVALRLVRPFRRLRGGS